MPKVFGHLACLCPVVCYILHLIQIKWINFSLCCIVYPVGFLLAIPPPPLPTDVFQCEGHLFVFPLLWGLMDGLCCCTSHKGGGRGLAQFIGWLPKVKAPGYFRHPASV